MSKDPIEKLRINKEDYYINDRGLMVFTKEYHLKRGYCCKNSCKHCPYKSEKNNKSFDL